MGICLPTDTVNRIHQVLAIVVVGYQNREKGFFTNRILWCILHIAEVLGCFQGDGLFLFTQRLINQRKI